MLGLLALLCSAAPARADDATEYRLKAAFLYKFALYTEWPAEVGPTLVLCLLGPDPFGADIDALQGKPVNGRSLALQRRAGLDGAAACHIAYLAPALAAQAPRLAAELGSAPVLTIADSPGAARAGVVINMMVQDSKVGFEANLASARRAGVTLSSKLLRLAAEVYQ